MTIILKKIHDQIIFGFQHFYYNVYLLLSKREGNAEIVASYIVILLVGLFVMGLTFPIKLLANKSLSFGYVIFPFLFLFAYAFLYANESSFKEIHKRYQLYSKEERRKYAILSYGLIILIFLSVILLSVMEKKLRY